MTGQDKQGHVDDLMAAYALDAVDADERAQIEAHLAGCAQCRTAVQEFREMAVRLSYGLDVPAAPELRERVLAQVAAEASVVRPLASRRRPSWVWGVAAAGVLAVGSWGVWETLSPDLTAVEQVVQASDAVRHEAEISGGEVAVVESAEEGRAVLVADGLPALSEDEVYQAWFVLPDGSVQSAGLMGPADPDIELEGSLEQATAVALTVEPAGGSELPTSEPLGAVPLES